MYILGGYFNNYVLSVRTKPQTHFQEWREELTTDVNRPSDPQTVIVVVLLSMDFWNCRVNSVGSYPES